MSGGLSSPRIAMMVIIGLALVAVHTLQNTLPNLQSGIQTRTLSIKSDTNQNELVRNDMKQEIKQLKIQLDDLQDILHQYHGNLQSTKSTRDENETATAEDGLPVVVDGNNNVPRPTLVKKKYRGWTMMHTLKAGGNSVEHMLRTVGYDQKNNRSC
jgi:seryl-tRNA synthetase